MGDPVGLIRLIRPVNCVMIGFAILVGAAMGSGIGSIGSLRDLFLAFLTGFTLTGGAMAINDYHDREIDSINEPGRPIPSGAVTPGLALATSLVLSAIGLVSSWMTGLSSLALASFAWVAMMFYSTAGKRTGLPGNLIVSTCISLPFVYGVIVTGSTALGFSLLFALTAFLTNTGREVTKSIVDVKGDEALGINTVAVSRGAQVAAWVSTFCYLLAVTVSFIPRFLGIVSFWYVPFVAFTDVGLIYLSLSLIRGPSRENSRRVKNRVLLLMMIGLLGFLAGSLL
jgi:geranylgeranylglycerol-phosphate geranylgeranyltransferase